MTIADPGGIGGQVKKNKIAVLHLLYHEISSIPQDYSYVLAEDSFRKHLQIFQKVQDKEIEARVTFDDGHVSNYNIALPMLLEHQITAQFFITAGWTSKRIDYMTWAQLRELHSCGHKIGAHGLSHKLFTHCSDKELAVELSLSRQMLEDKLGVPVTSLSFPGGRFNKHVLAACSEAGYTQMFTSAPMIETDTSSSLIGRLNVRGDWSSEYIASLLDLENDALSRLQRQDVWKTFAKRLLGDNLYGRLWAAANHKKLKESVTVSSGS
jgi:peptidoglycan/xylan/chitin deacetylase (PgdA/CDA1 family)